MTDAPPDPIPSPARYVPPVYDRKAPRGIRKKLLSLGLITIETPPREIHIIYADLTGRKVCKYCHRAHLANRRCRPYKTRMRQNRKLRRLRRIDHLLQAAHERYLRWSRLHTFIEFDLSSNTDILARATSQLQSAYAQGTPLPAYPHLRLLANGRYACACGMTDPSATPDARSFIKLHLHGMDPIPIPEPATSN
jgi:hypothetical protein